MFTIKKSNIDFEFTDDGKSQKNYQMLPDEFMFLIMGKPGSGKTSLIRELIQNDKLYKQKFHLILFISPSEIVTGLTEDNWSKKFDLGWLNQKIFDFNEMILEKKIKNAQMLIIFDDFISDIKLYADHQFLKTLIFNRRKLLNNDGRISLILTSQYFMEVPSRFRACLYGIFLFSVNQNEWRKIENEIQINKKAKGFMDTLCSFVFKNKYSFLYIQLLTNKLYHKFDEIQF